MSKADGQPERSRALFGIRGDYVDTIEDRLAKTQTENTELTESLDSAHLALEQTAGWSKRLPAALRDFATLASGQMEGEDTEERLAAAVLALAGEHLLATVNVRSGDPTGELEKNTQRNEQGRPILTRVRIGACAVDCTWQPGVDAGPDTTDVVEGLATALVCSLVGMASTRTTRDVVTQLGDSSALGRHVALRNRLQQPAALVIVTVNGESQVSYRELFGRMAWDASLADAAAILDRLARASGGQAYQTADREFRLLIDAEEGEHASEQAERALAEYAPLLFRVTIANR